MASAKVKYAARAYNSKQAAGKHYAKVYAYWITQSERDLSVFRFQMMGTYVVAVLAWDGGDLKPPTGGKPVRLPASTLSMLHARWRDQEELGSHSIHYEPGLGIDLEGEGN